MGTANGPVTWTFQWTAPPAQSGEVRFSAEEVSTPVQSMTWGKIKQRYR